MCAPGNAPGVRGMTDPAVDKLSETLDATTLDLDSPIQLVDTEEAVRRVTSDLLAAGTPVAVDFEGRDLCRAGKLDLMQLSNGTRTWLIDVTTLGEEAFSAGARELLESENVLKVGYDGRADADALWHLHKTMLTIFYDVQIASCKRQDATEGRRDRVVHGLGRAMDVFLRGDRARQATLAWSRTPGAGSLRPSSVAAMTSGPSGRCPRRSSSTRATTWRSCWRCGRRGSATRQRASTSTPAACASARPCTVRAPPRAGRWP